MTTVKIKKHSSEWYLIQSALTAYYHVANVELERNEDLGYLESKEYEKQRELSKELLISKFTD